MAQHKFISGVLQDVATNLNVLQNGSGASQSLALWDVTICVSSVYLAAGATRQPVTLAVNGVTAVVVPILLIQNTIANYSAYFNLQGQQFSFPNGSFVTLSCAAATAFWHHSVAMVYDSVTGS